MDLSIPPVPVDAQARLCRIRARLESDFARLSEEATAAEDELKAHLSDSGHPDGGADEGDLGLRSSSLEQESGVVSNAAHLLAQTARALAHLESGTYGTCDSCQVVIDLERLEAFPRATHCVPCQRRADLHTSSGRVD